MKAMDSDERKSNPLDVDIVDLGVEKNIVDV
jgi:hypothetical protein